MQRNVEEYSRFWSHRFRRRWNYPSQSKVKHFRAMMSAHGWLRKEGLSVFDQGFGLGLMLFCFRKSCSLAGIELSPAAVAAAAAEARARGYQDADLRTFELGCPFPSEWKSRFDVLISSHVLEHLEDPAKALTELGQLLKDSGVACLVVPIHEEPGEDLNHFSWFTPDSFLELVRASGLEPVDARTCDRLWDVMSPLAYALQRRVTLGRRLASIVVNASTAFLPRVALRALDWVLGWLGWEERQLFVLCRKRAIG